MKRAIWLSAVFGAIPVTIGLVYGAESVFSLTSFQLHAQVAGTFLCSVSFIALTFDLVLRFLSSGTVARFFRRHLAFLGGYIAHIGVLLAIFGFLGNYHSDQKVAALAKGEITSLAGYQFKFDKIEMVQSDNVLLIEAHLDLMKEGKVVDLLKPARSKYKNRTDTLHEVSVRSSFFHDVYVTISKLGTGGGKTTFEFNIKRTVMPVWIAAVLLCLGGGICVLDRRRGLKSRDILRRADIA